MGSCLTSNYIVKNATLENTVSFSMIGKTCNVKIIDVYDGDTVTIAFLFQGVLCNQKCRVQGIDCAELKTHDDTEKKFGYEAKTYLESIILGKVVTAIFEKTDKFGRLLAKLMYTEQETLADHMIDRGFGYEYNGEKKLKFDEWFDKSTGKARSRQEIREIKLLKNFSKK
jgi:endonuclease YncB( thermonuclease family)